MEGGSLSQGASDLVSTERLGIFSIFFLLLWASLFSRGLCLYFQDPMVLQALKELPCPQRAAHFCQHGMICHHYFLINDDLKCCTFFFFSF